jgi:hypothetical protein
MTSDVEKGHQESRARTTEPGLRLSSGSTSPGLQLMIGHDRCDRDDTLISQVQPGPAA